MTFEAPGSGGSRDPRLAMPRVHAMPEDLRTWAFDLILGLADSEAPLVWTALPPPRGPVALVLWEAGRPVAQGEWPERVWPWLLSHLKKVARLDAAERRLLQRGLIQPEGSAGRVWVETASVAEAGTWPVERLVLRNETAEALRLDGTLGWS